MSLFRKSREELEQTMDELVELFYSKMKEQIRKDILSDDDFLKEFLSQVRDILSERIEDNYRTQRNGIEEDFHKNASCYASSSVFEKAKEYRRVAIGENYALYEKRKALLEELGL